MELLPTAPPCNFAVVHTTGDLVNILEHIGLKGYLLEKEPIPFHIQNQQEATQCILKQLLTCMHDGGSPKRHSSILIALESGLGGGKTHTAATLKDSLCEAINEALRKAGSLAVAGYAVHKELRAAFHNDGTRQARVATIHLEFDGDDGPSERDVKASTSVFLGLRLFSRGFLGVSTKRLRSVLPPHFERRLTTAEVWPLVCARLRRLHGLAPFAPELVAHPEQWLVLLLTLDEIQQIQSFLESVGWAGRAATKFCRDLCKDVSELVYMGTSSPVSPSAACGVVLQPVLLATCSWAFHDRLPSVLPWEHIALQPLGFGQSKQLLMHTLFLEPAYIQLLPAKIDWVAFFERLFETVEMQGALEMGGGVPGILTAGAQALTSAAVLPEIERLINNSVWEEPCVSDLAMEWTSTWANILKEQFLYSNLIDTLGVAAAKELLLLVLSGNPVRQTQKLSGCTLCDALAPGAFYVNDYGGRECSITLPAILLQLFYDALSTRPGPAVYCEAAREAITQLIKPQVKSHKDAPGEPFEVMVAAQLLVIAACWRALGNSAVGFRSIFRAAHKGIQGGFLSPNLDYTGVELHETMRMLIGRNNGSKWCEKGASAPRRASQLNPWLRAQRPPHAASAGLLDPGYAVLVDSWSDCAVQPVAGVGIRLAYNTQPPGRPILLLLNLMLREDPHDLGSTLCIGRTGSHEPTSEDAALPFQPVIGLVTPGNIDEAAFKPASASEQALLIISGDACAEFIPVLRHRPILQQVCAAASHLNNMTSARCL